MYKPTAMNIPEGRIRRDRIAEQTCTHEMDIICRDIYIRIRGKPTDELTPHCDRLLIDKSILFTIAERTSTAVLRCLCYPAG